MVIVKRYENLAVAGRDLQAIGRESSRSPFQTHWYLDAFTRNFGAKGTSILGLIEADSLVAIGAFQAVGKTIQFLGTRDVSKDNIERTVTDYGDVLLSQRGQELAADVWGAIRDHFVPPLNLEFIRNDSPTVTALKNAPGSEVSPVLDTSTQLPLHAPAIKLHEGWRPNRNVRRKIAAYDETHKRDLREEDDLESAFRVFIDLHKRSHPGKAAFMDEQMEAFFWDLTTCSKENGWQTKFYSLYVDKKPVATVMAFEQGDNIYLYNSGYDPEYSDLSVGILIHAFIIEKSIREGRNMYDFLRGDERYKYDLGAEPMDLLNITLNRPS